MPDSEVAFEDGAWVTEALVANQRALVAFAERRLGDRAAAEDLVHDALVRNLARPPALRDSGAVLSWLYQVLRNAIADRRRRDARNAAKLEAFARELETFEPGSEAGGVVCACVSRIASTLKPEYAMALTRVEIDGIAVKDYAAEAGITASNAGVRLFRARDALRKRLARSCGTCATHGCFDCTCKARDPG